MNRTQLVILQIFLLGLVLAGCSNSQDSADSGVLPTTPGESSPSQPTSPVLTSPPVALTPVIDVPTTSDASAKPVETSPVATEPTSETLVTGPTTEAGAEASLPLTVVLVSVTEPIPSGVIAETLSVETAPSQPEPLLSEVLTNSSSPASDEPQVTNESQPLNEVQPPPESPTQTQVESNQTASDQITESPNVDTELPALSLLEPLLTALPSSDTLISQPAATTPETAEPLIATPAPAPVSTPAPVQSPDPQPASAPAPASSPVVSNPPATPTTDDSGNVDQQVEVKGKCSGKKNVKITVTHTQKNQGSEKVIVKCTKDSFTVRLSFKKKDLPFIQILTEAFN